MHTNNKDLLSSDIDMKKLILKMSMPIIIAQIANALYGIVDRAYIGHIKNIGIDALTGIGVTAPLIVLVSSFSYLVAAGGAPLSSIMLGKGEEKRADKVIGNCFSGLLIISVVLTGILLAFGEQLLMMFGASDATIIYALPYLRIYSVGTIFVQLTLGLNMFITAQGNTTTSMLTVIIGAVINIILDPLFIFVFDMGVKGAALATIISQAISCVWVLCFVCSERSLLRLKKENLRFESKIILPCLGLGLSPFVMQSTNSLINFAFNTSLYKYGGDMAVGAMTILSSVMTFAVYPMQGLTQGAQPVIGYNYGARKPEKVKKAFKILLIYCAIYCTVAWLIMMIFPTPFIRVFTDNEPLLNYTIVPFRIYMCTLCVLSIQFACQQSLVALGNSKYSVILAIVRKIVLIAPLIYIFPYFFENKVYAVLYSEPVSNIIAVTVTFIVFIVQFRKALKKIETTDDKSSVNSIDIQ